MSWKSRVALWAALFAAFLGLYLGIGILGRYDVDWLASPVVVLVVFPIVFGIILQRRLKGTALLNEGLAFIDQGRYLSATEKFVAARPYLQAGIVQFYLGTTHLLLWRIEPAQTAFEAAKPSLSYRALAGLTPTRLGLVHALRGNAEAALAQLAKGEAAGRRDSSDSLLTKSILACRAAHWEEAEVVLARNELRSLGGPLRGLADALRSWVAFTLHGERRYLDRIALFGETDASGLRKVWPEFIAFIESASPDSP